jgi:hypothetical protein
MDFSVFRPHVADVGRFGQHAGSVKIVFWTERPKR